MSTPGGYNVNISAGARNLREKKKTLQNNARKIKNRKELRERTGEMLVVKSYILSGVHISGSGKLSC